MCPDKYCTASVFSSCDCHGLSSCSTGGGGGGSCCPGTWASSSNTCLPTPAPTTTAASQCHSHDSCSTCLDNDSCYWCYEDGKCKYHGEQNTPCDGTDYCVTQPGKYAKWACKCTACGAGGLKCQRGAIIGIVIGSIAGVALLITICVCYCRRQTQKYQAEKLQRAYQQQQQQPVAYLTAAVPSTVPVAPAVVTDATMQRYGSLDSEKNVGIA